MSEQLSTSRRTVAIAMVALIAAAGAFGSAFYLLDGAEVVASTARRASALVVNYFEPEPEAAEPPAARPVTLSTPPGMPTEFALRLWQEQIDSQDLIGRVVQGQAKTLSVDKVVRVDKQNTKLLVTVGLSDGETIEGVIGLRRFGDVDYVSYVASNRDAGYPAGPLPSIDDVDVELLNTMLAQNAASQPVIAEYVGGIVKKVNLGNPKVGPRTVSIDLSMDETHGTGYARLVAVKSEVDGREVWMLTRFKKTGHDPANL